jgi:chromosome segregation ATPase
MPGLLFDRLHDLSLSEPFLEEEDSVTSGSLPELRAQLSKLELEGAQKTDLIRQKDELIEELEERLSGLQRKKGKLGKVVRPSTSETIEFYRSRYENVLLQLQSLKTSLSEEGKLKKVSARSARAIRPRVP